MRKEGETVNEAIFHALQALNEIDVRGERNHDLLLYAIQQLKPLQTAVLVKPDQALTEVEDDGSHGD